MRHPVFSPCAQHRLGEFFAAGADAVRTRCLGERLLTARRLGNAGQGETMWLLALRAAAGATKTGQRPIRPGGFAQSLYSSASVPLVGAP